MKNIINLIAMITMFCSNQACAMGGKSVKPRKEQDKMWHFCQDFEMKYHNNLPAKGRVCNNTCTFYKRGKCKNWQRNMKDLNKDEDFNFFRDGAFILIDEDILRGQ